MGFVANLNAINPDAFIVRQNIARYWAGGDLDAAYLTSLSADAVPALAAAVNSPCPAGSTPAQEACKSELVGPLREGLRDRWQALQDDPGWQQWPSARLSTWRAYRQLAGMFATIAPGSP